MREASLDDFLRLVASRQGVFLQKGRKLNWYKLSTHNRPIVGSNPTRPTTLMFQEAHAQCAVKQNGSSLKGLALETQNNRPKEPTIVSVFLRPQKAVGTSVLRQLVPEIL
jgi:hypothetical protein